jgi:hypothetical protein
MATVDETVSGSASGLRRDAIGLREARGRHPERVTQVGLVHIDAPELRAVAEVGSE